MRELTMTELCGVAGGGDWITVSCCEINVGPMNIKMPTFSFGLPETDSSISSEYREMNGGIPRG